MTIPNSTYRLQFRGETTFDRASEMIPSLKNLGISHVYASPIFTATKGSTHGYDVTNANEIDPAIGGREAFDDFSTNLQRAGLGLILDIVPNHMAASPENPWWSDVLQYGEQSAYAHHFDIDWSRKLTLPQLGKPLNDVLAAGELQFSMDPEGQDLLLTYFDSRFPLSAESAQHVMAETGGEQGQLQAFSADITRMKSLLDAQLWQLIHWKDAARHLTYRRFFEVAGLIGLRMEDERVFEETHRLTFELVRSGQVQGLRIDHIDGLADPKTYLERLRKTVGANTFIVVEKILGPDEVMPQDWPVSGTTGYEFISAVADLFVASDGLSKIDEAYARVAPDQADYAAGLRRAKQSMVERNFEGEVARLAGLFSSLYPDIQKADILPALQELLIAFPVYRTYGDHGPLSAEDDIVLRSAIKEASAKASPDVLHTINRLLRGDIVSKTAIEFRTRFQQLSGPVMAKAIEDTHFYRYNRLIAVNEVGGEPVATARGVAAFHERMAERLRHQPCGLSATSTHDTKRGEDARARLYGLSQQPDAWIAGVSRWRALNAGLRTNLPDGPAPEPNVEWMLYQTLAGIWADAIECADRSALMERFDAYAVKAVREAKMRTDWTDENAAYEDAIANYAKALLTSDNQAFERDFVQTLRPFIETGYLISLSQLLIKLTAPGIPDIYQGAEGLDFSMVDPDNRRPIADRGSDVAETSRFAWEEREVALLKQRVIQKALRYRNKHPGLFRNGDYLPLKVSGRRADNLVAFARTRGEKAAITVAPRLVDASDMRADFWDDTAISIPAAIDGHLHDLLTGSSSASGEISAARLLAGYPLALLVAGG